jgi:hypothetical protein
MTLLEAVVAVVVLSVAVPPTLMLLGEAAASRTDSIITTKAAMYAQTLLEQIIADVASPQEGLGFDAIAMEDAYLEGLVTRLENTLIPYQASGLSHTIQIGLLAPPDGLPTGDPQLDVYRRVRIEIAYPSSSTMQTLVIEQLLTEIAP